MSTYPLNVSSHRRQRLLDAAGWRRALRDAVIKLSPRHLLHSPVMAVVMAGTVVSLVVTLSGNAPLGFGLAVTAILLLTVLFGNFAEAVAEARGRARRPRCDGLARTSARAGWLPRMPGPAKPRYRPPSCARATM